MTKGFNINIDPKENGQFEFFDETGSQTFRSLQCMHCGEHWMVEPGSGKLRGYCQKCEGYLCGKRLCLTECVPLEAQVELYEGNPRTIQKYKGTETERVISLELARAKKNNEILIAEAEAMNKGESGLTTPELLITILVIVLLAALVAFVITKMNL